jgi:hypothetical protein
MSSPPFFSFFLFDALPPFFSFDRAAGFLLPRPHIVASGRVQMLSRLAALYTLTGATVFLPMPVMQRLGVGGTCPLLSAVELTRIMQQM